MDMNSVKVGDLLFGIKDGDLLSIDKVEEIKRGINGVGWLVKVKVRVIVLIGL